MNNIIIKFLLQVQVHSEKNVHLRYKASFALFECSATLSFFKDLAMQALLREQSYLTLLLLQMLSISSSVLSLSVSLICWETVGRGPWYTTGMGFIRLAFLFQLQLDLLSRAIMDFVVLIWLDFVLTDWSYAILHQTDTCLTLVF